MDHIEQFFTELKKLLESMPEKPPEMTKEVEDAYKAYGFDVKNPPTDGELAKWATQLIYNWHGQVSDKLNLPLTGLCVAYNMVTFGKLNELDQLNLKTLLSAVYHMGYGMGVYKLRTPFDPKPKSQDLN